MEFPSPTAGSCTGLAWLRSTLSDTATNDTPKQNILTGSIVVSSLTLTTMNPSIPLRVEVLRVFRQPTHTLDKSRRRDTLSSLSFLCYKCITVTVDSLP